MFFLTGHFLFPIMLENNGGTLHGVKNRGHKRA